MQTPGLWRRWSTRGVRDERAGAVTGRRPDWSLEGRDWPNREASRFIDVGGRRRHVQVLGSGPVLLLLHGAGGATHSWRDLAPRLARAFTVVAPDLPGHGFSEADTARELTLPGMAGVLGDLLGRLALSPDYAVGHSAGAAVALRLQLDGRIRARALVSLNGALQPFPGLAGRLAPHAARAIFLNPFAIGAFARRARSAPAVAALIESTGSRLDARGLELYGRLFRCPGHVGATLGMMAGWRLEPLLDDLPRLTTPLVLVAADGDRAVPPKVAQEALRRTSVARLVSVPHLGHLAHEEAPDAAAALIIDALAQS